MAVDVDWTGAEANPYRIFIPRADMTLTQASPEIRELDLDALRLELRDLEASTAGMPWPKTHIHNTQTNLAGVTYARQVNIISPYSVEFEDGVYRVVAVGANHNISDVLVVNSVSLVTNNSAGLIVAGGSGAADIWDALLSSHQTAGSAGWVLQRVLDLLEADVIATPTALEVRRRTDDALLLSKTITGGSVIAATVED